MKKLSLAALIVGLAAQVMAAGTYNLNPATTQFVANNGISLPDPFLDNQKQGLNWMVQPGCSTGDHKVGGIPITCKGDKVGDIKTYVSLVNSTNFYYCMYTNPNDPVCQQ